MTRHYCQGPECHTYKTQSRIRGVKGAKVLRTRYAYTTFNPATLNCWEDYFCNESCLGDWLKKHMTQVINFIGIRNKPLETPIDVVKETFNRTDWRGNPYKQTDTTIKLLSEQSDDDTVTA
jgi:hypothetical protein